jgi:uncharacterized protein
MITTTNPSDSIDIQVLHTILSNLVTVPEDIKISRTLDEQGVLLSVIVNPQDMGIIIGRNGSMAMSIKSIMRAVGKAHKMTLRVQFLEPDGTAMYSNNFEDRPKNFEDRNNKFGDRGDRENKAPKYQNSQLAKNYDNLPKEDFSYNKPVNNNAIKSDLPPIDDLDEFSLN